MKLYLTKSKSKSNKNEGIYYIRNGKVANTSR